MRIEDATPASSAQEGKAMHVFTGDKGWARWSGPDRVYGRLAAEETR
jgi:hypothetical protein